VLLPGRAFVDRLDHQLGIGLQVLQAQRFLKADQPLACR